MKRHWYLISLLLPCFAGLRFYEDDLAPTHPVIQKPHLRPRRQRLQAKVAHRPSLAARQRRRVLEPGNATDPFERVEHSDDWVSRANSAFLDFGSPVCVTEAGDSKQQCKLISQRLCANHSDRVLRMDERLGTCFARRKSCVVVGSSEHLLSVSWGEFIDSHDLVIRLNGAPTGSTDKASECFSLRDHVGTRTDVRFLNEFGQAPADLSSGPPTCLFLHEPEIPENCGQDCWNHPGACNVTCKEAPGTDFCTRQRCDISRLRCRGASQQVEGKTYKEREAFNWGNHTVILDNVHGGIADQVVPHPTAGFKAVMYAMSTCEHVTVMGFGPACSGDVGKRYYPGNFGGGKGLWHHYSEELALLIRASELGMKAIIPPEARMRITAKTLTVALPTCVNREQARRLD